MEHSWNERLPIISWRLLAESILKFHLPPSRKVDYPSVGFSGFFFPSRQSPRPFWEYCGSSVHTEISMCGIGLRREYYPAWMNISCHQKYIEYAHHRL